VGTIRCEGATSRAPKSTRFPIASSTLTKDVAAFFARWLPQESDMAQAKVYPNQDIHGPVAIHIGDSTAASDRGNKVRT
jgi:hypothetical protein